MFKLTAAQIAGFADCRAAYLPSEIGAGPAFRPAVEQHVAALVRLTEPEVCASRRAHFKAELSADAFRERVLMQDGARVVVGGIRFRNLDPGFPFVEVNANFDLFAPDATVQLAQAAWQQFGAFEPQGILATGPPRVGLPDAVEPWAHTLAGPTWTHRQFPLRDGLICSFPSSVDFYDPYRRAYADWQASSPRLRRFVRTESRKDLEASAAEGLLASFADAQGWCGVVAASEEAFYGTPALYIFEIFLVERWRGKGAAAGIDAALLARIAARSSLVWERIHAENTPSLRVALERGRAILETEYFFPYREDGRLQVGDA